VTLEQFSELHTECTRALNNYYSEAQRTCNLLLECEAGPMSFGQRSALIEQRAREIQAHVKYQDLRYSLFDLARVGYAPES
jgi:hypothetical protein